MNSQEILDFRAAILRLSRIRQNEAFASVYEILPYESYFNDISLVANTIITVYESNPDVILNIQS